MNEIDGFRINSDLGSSRKALHELFSVIFPSQSRIKGNRLNGLLYLYARGPIGLRESRSLLISKFSVESRQALYTTIKNLKNAGLVEEKEGKLQLSELGKRVVESLRLFCEHFSGDLRLEEPKEAINQPFYEISYVNLFTNGREHASYLWVWEVNNQGNSPLEKLEYRAASGGSPLDQLKLEHSNNISDYSVTVDQPDFKIFELHFKEPIQPGERKRYWYSYKWPRNYDPEWRPWRFTFYCGDFPIVALSINIINTKEISVKPETIGYKIEPSSDDSFNFRKSQCNLDFMPSPDFNFLIFEAKNIPRGTVIEINWDFDYQGE